MSFSFSENKNCGGFTVLELLVVIAIILVVTLVIIANLGSFRSQVALDLIAQEVAINIRGAQVFGLGTRQSFSNNFPAYGIYFSKESEDSFILFSDSINGNRRYDPDDGCGGERTECQELYTLERRVQIAGLCYYNTDNNECQPTNELHITYKRPYTDATIKTKEDETAYYRASIKIYQPGGGEKDYRLIWVYANGQIAVQRP